MKNISIFKNTNKKSENSPDYRVVASWQVGDEWKDVTVASLWKNDSENPNAPTLKGKMMEEYTNEEGKTFPAFEIKRADNTKSAQENPVEAAQAINPEDIPF